MDKRRDVRAIGATFGIGIAVALGAWGIGASQGGCALKNCDPTSQPDFAANPNPTWEVGEALDADTWESAPLYGDWLLFPGQRFQGFDLGRMIGYGPKRRILEILVYLSPDKHPTDPGASFALGAGNIAEVSTVPDPPGGTGSALWIHNDSCANYYVRVVVRLEPIAAPADAGTDAEDAADSSSSEAGDASSTLDAGDAGPNDANEQQEQ